MNFCLFEDAKKYHKKQKRKNIQRDESDAFISFSSLPRERMENWENAVERRECAPLIVKKVHTDSGQKEKVYGTKRSHGWRGRKKSKHKGKKSIRAIKWEDPLAISFTFF